MDCVKRSPFKYISFLECLAYDHRLCLECAVVQNLVTYEKLTDSGVFVSMSSFHFRIAKRHYHIGIFR